MDDEFEIDGIQLDRDNREFNLALDYVLHTRQTIYLTGKAGTGKTTFLKYLKKVVQKNMVVLAPTGVAAVNAGGQTIHSFFQIPPSIYIPGDRRLRTEADPNDPDGSTIYDNFKYGKEKTSIIKRLQLLVIDEVSMVKSNLLDVIDTLLRVLRGVKRPFGGVQVLLIGDTFQLPPVVTGEEKDILYRFYESEFFFSAKVLQQVPIVYIELKKIYRQSDQNFIDLLNRIRVNNMLESDFSLFRSKYRPSFVPDEKEHYITLATTNSVVSHINSKKLDELSTPLRTYQAAVEGDFPEKERPTDTLLTLKVGAQVMFVKNEPGEKKRYYNGTIGVISRLEEERVFVMVLSKNGEITEHAVEPETWEKICYTYDQKELRINEKKIGEFKQFPVKLAWAVTVHKSQGLTFDRVIADLGNSFAAGQVYVALSRCTSWEGLVLSSLITFRSIKTDPRVLEFAKKETPETLLTESLENGKADFYYEQAREALDALNAQECIDNFYRALSYRNDMHTEQFKRYLLFRMYQLFNKAKKKKKKEKSPATKTELQIEKPLERSREEESFLQTIIRRTKSKSGNGLADVAGMHEIKSILQKKIINILKDPGKAKKYKIKIPNGMLLYGPPGCGKSFIAEKFAEEAGYNYVFIKSSDLASVYIHGSQEKIGDLFEKARQNAPTILNFDEFEALVPNRMEGEPGYAGEVNEFLSQMNNCGEDHVFIIASSNRPDLIDPAILRKGRIDEIIYIPVPDKEAREGMFEIHMKGRPVSGIIDYSRLAELTENFVASDIAYIVNEAATRAFENDVEITETLLEEIIKKTKPSVSAKNLKVYEEMRTQMESNAKESERHRIGFV